MKTHLAGVLEGLEKREWGLGVKKEEEMGDQPEAREAVQVPEIASG